MGRSALDRETARSFARVALENILRRYPYKLDHMMAGAGDLAGPAAWHPVFCGSYDWHSSVHMHWLLVRLLALYPDLEEAPRIRAMLDAQLRPDAMAAELAYFRRTDSRTFERPYGWGWMLKLQAELLALARHDPHASVWAEACAPLASHLSQQLAEFLDAAAFPVRTGTHYNSAFALVMALAYARTHQDMALRRAIVRRAHRWFGHDQKYPARYEPGGDEFLSGGLTEGVLMHAVMDGCAFSEWWELFVPGQAELANWLTPVTVTNRNDPKAAHLDGLNLSRAWCWRLLEPALPEPLRPLAIRAWSDHIEASLPQAVEGEYVSTHWLASFAVLALAEPIGG
ncbi:MAG: DUF2891 domain-containing protein [Cupriavidus sp.]|nr:DUF2891 domain-containing protein [Cupriavidus sp.]